MCTAANSTPAFDEKHIMVMNSTVSKLSITNIVAKGYQLTRLAIRRSPTPIEFHHVRVWFAPLLTVLLQGNPRRQSSDRHLIISPDKTSRKINIAERLAFFVYLRRY